ncbi:MAG: V-type ATPase subunit [Clostridia bacterium]
MPQQSTLYGVARVRCHEKELLGRDRMARIADASAEDALRQLIDAGYGGMPDAKLADTEQMISRELTAARELVSEVSPCPAITDIFLMKADIHNLKLLLKLRLTGSNDEPALMQGGVYSTAALSQMVREADYSALPELLRNALDSLEAGFLIRIDPIEVSVRLDNAYIKYALANGNAFTKAYFSAQADFDNLLALLRLKATGADAEKLRRVLLDAGDIPREKLVSALDMPLENIGRAIVAGSARSAIIAGLDEVIRTGHISALEKARDNYLIGLARAGKDEPESIAPIIGYLLAREQEARCVRLVITSKRNGLPENIIAERLRELYG